jgi:succinoglycan biosynthesis protein ExoM
MTMDTGHYISVCVCTYKRPAMLKRLLDSLREQDTGGLFTYSIVVVDNDALQSAKAVVSDFQAVAGIPITYSVEPQQSIALARNKAVENATGDFIAFIDDDEFPIKRWLLTLFTVCNERDVDGVIGPVKPHFDVEPPKWVIEGKFHERATYPTGLVIDWRKGRTGNTFLRKRVLAACEQPFNPEFRQGEDQEFFYRVIQKGFVFIWCNEAVAYEVIPPLRWQRRFLLRRALLRGALEPKTPNFGARDIAKSVIAAPAYAAALPFVLILGESKFMALLVRLFDHLGKLLVVMGVNPIKAPYVTE